MNKLVATTTDSSYHTFDLRTFNPESGFACLRHNVSTRIVFVKEQLLTNVRIQFGGENVTVWGVRHLPQNRDVFITSCADGTMQLYK